MTIRGLDKRGSWTFADLLFFMLFYIPMTVIVVALLVSIPGKILNARIITGELDSLFLSERLLNRVSYVDVNTGRAYPGFILDRSAFGDELLRDAFFFPQDRQQAIKLVLDGKSVMYNSGFYEIARPIAPVRYGLFVSQKEMIVQNEKSNAWLTIEQVFKKT